MSVRSWGARLPWWSGKRSGNKGINAVAATPRGILGGPKSTWNFETFSMQSPLATTRDAATKAKSSPRNFSTCSRGKTSKVAASEAQCQDMLEGKAAFRPSARANDGIDFCACPSALCGAPLDCSAFASWNSCDIDSENSWTRYVSAMLRKGAIVAAGIRTTPTPLARRSRRKRQGKRWGFRRRWRRQSCMRTVKCIQKPCKKPCKLHDKLPLFGLLADPDLAWLRRSFACRKLSLRDREQRAQGKALEIGSIQSFEANLEDLYT